MFTYLRSWFSMVYRLFFPKPKPKPPPPERQLDQPSVGRVWDPIILDETPIFSISKTIATSYAPIKDSLSYRRTRRAINRRRSTPGYNSYSGGLTYSRIT